MMASERFIELFEIKERALFEFMKSIAVSLSLNDSILLIIGRHSNPPITMAELLGENIRGVK
jgi:hypothetical protein